MRRTASTKSKKPTRRPNPSTEKVMEEFERVSSALQTTLEQLGVTPNQGEQALAESSP